MIQAALHLAAAALICLLAGQTALPVIGGALLLALAPDLDTPKSLVGALAAPLSRRIERTVGHRTATHSLLALALVAGLAYLLAPAAWGVLAGAYASHLALDLLIGVQGIKLFWPVGEWFTLAAWRNDGPAPRALLVTLLSASALIVLWPTIAPTFSPQVSAALNPIATPKPATPTHTLVPAITLRLALPVGVSLSALRVRAGDQLREGQVIAAWDPPAVTPWPSPSAVALPPTPAAPLDPPADAAAERALADALAAQAALATSQVADAAALHTAQQRQIADADAALLAAQRALDALQPQHERAQAEHQHAVAQAQQALADAQAAQRLADPADPSAIQRAAERVHTAEAALLAALDAQDRMRTAQGIERQQAEAAVAQAQQARAGLPDQQRQALTQLATSQRAVQILAQARVASARSQLADAQAARRHTQARADADATAAALVWQAQADATAQAAQDARRATALAQPTPAPSQIRSRASGRIVAISAEEQDGQFVVILEVAP